MEVFSDTPGVQLYTSNYIESIKGKKGAIYKRRHGLCLETQHYPDSINVPAKKFKEFSKGKCFHLIPDKEEYKHTVIYSFGALQTSPNLP